MFLSVYAQPVFVCHTCVMIVMIHVIMSSKQETDNTNIARGEDTAGKEATVVPLVSPRIINYDSFYYCPTTPYHNLSAWRCNQIVDINEGYSGSYRCQHQINLNCANIWTNAFTLLESVLLFSIFTDFTDRHSSIDVDFVLLIMACPKTTQ